jgi:hypothetical protein
MKPVQLPAIPWSHESSDFGSVWQWETTHFIVVVNGNERSCYFQISDKMSSPAGSPKPIADGQAATFQDAELQIRETIGKAYPAKLGYQRIAGPLATSFVIATGNKIDLGEYAGQNVVVTIANRDGSESQYSGIANVLHYHMYLKQGEQSLKISPSHILNIKVGTLRGGAASSNPAPQLGTPAATPVTRPLLPPPRPPKHPQQEPPATRTAHAGHNAQVHQPQHLRQPHLHQTFRSKKHHGCHPQPALQNFPHNPKPQSSVTAHQPRRHPQPYPQVTQVAAS